MKKEQKPFEFGHKLKRQIPLWAWVTIAAYMILVANLVPTVYDGWGIISGWFAAGVLCLVNFKSCGRYHCRITGPGFIVLGILELLNTIGVIELTGWVIWIVLFVVLGVGFGLEFRYKSRCGTCYVPLKSK